MPAVPRWSIMKNIFFCPLELRHNGMQRKKRLQLFVDFWLTLTQTLWNAFYDLFSFWGYKEKNVMFSGHLLWDLFVARSEVKMQANARKGQKRRIILWIFNKSCKFSSFEDSFFTSADRKLMDETFRSLKIVPFVNVMEIVHLSFFQAIDCSKHLPFFTA